MSVIPATIRDNALYAYGYLEGRSFMFPRSFSSLYGTLIAKTTSLIALPLPLLSFLALPFFGGSSTTINLVFFYLTWSALIWTYDPLTVELVGTLAIRMLFFVVPALGFLAFDATSPSMSKSLKAKREKSLPLNLGRNRLLEIAAVATFNVLLAVAIQGAFELLTTEVFHMRSVLKVTTTVPLPWSIASDVFRGLIMRGILRYFIHRFLLHTYDTPLKTWHKKWQHSVRYPFSIIGAYDHPVNYLISQWLPVFLPAYFFRFHVLTWHIMLALVSLEELFVYSGYAVLPSTIMLTGMARRTDAHFLAAQTSKRSGNYGQIGLLDFVCGSTCPDEDDLFDDLQQEAEKHHVRERAESAASGAWEGLKDGDNSDDSDDEDDDKGEKGKKGDEKKPSSDSDKKPTRQRKTSKKSSGKKSAEDEDESAGKEEEKSDDGDDNEEKTPPKRRGGRRKAPKNE